MADLNDKERIIQVLRFCIEMQDQLDGLSKYNERIAESLGRGTKNGLKRAFRILLLEQDIVLRLKRKIKALGQLIGEQETKPDRGE